MNKEIWLWLTLVFGPYNPKLTEVVRRYSDVRAAAEAVRDEECDLLDDDERLRAKEMRSRQVESVIEVCDSNGIRIITIEDDEYPELLRSIPTPPVVLYVQGSLECLKDAPVLNVVGTREASAYAQKAARSICWQLVKVGMVLVSGLALGLDTVAHRTALECGGKTVGVLACGSLVDYPAANRELKQSIIRSGGAVISELPPYTAVNPDYFKHRNRIMSGLAHGTFIVEASEQSGCHLTAEHAVNQGRDLFCLPPQDILSPKYAGVVPYLRDGATPVFGYVDIVNAYQLQLFGDM